MHVWKKYNLWYIIIFKWYQLLWATVMWRQENIKFYNNVLIAYWRTWLVKQHTHGQLCCLTVMKKVVVCKYHFTEDETNIYNTLVSAHSSSFQRNYNIHISHLKCIQKYFLSRIYSCHWYITSTFINIFNFIFLLLVF